MPRVAVLHAVNFVQAQHRSPNFLVELFLNPLESSWVTVMAASKFKVHSR